MKPIIVLILFQLLLLPASAVSVFSSAFCFQQQLFCVLPVMKETKTRNSEASNSRHNVDFMCL